MSSHPSFQNLSHYFFTLSLEVPSFSVHVLIKLNNTAASSSRHIQPHKTLERTNIGNFYKPNSRGKNQSCSCRRRRHLLSAAHRWFTAAETALVLLARTHLLSPSSQQPPLSYLRPPPSLVWPPFSLCLRAFFSLMSSVKVATKWKMK